MPRYFFHTDDGTRIPDQVGYELPDATKAHQEAVRLTGAMLNHEPQLLLEGRDFRTEVADENGNTLLTVLVQTATGLIPKEA